MIVIVPDTNILFNSPLLDAGPWKSLGDHREEWAIQIAVPDVVEMETIRKVREKWTQECKPFEDARLGKFGLQDDVTAITKAIKARIDSYEADLMRRFTELGAEVVSPSAVDHLEIANRAAYGIAPYQHRTRDGYRDTVIWLTVMSIAEENPDAEVWFVSDNHKDFGPIPPNWTGDNQGSHNDCPILFHSHLRKDLDARGLVQRVKYVTSLQTLEQHLAALHGPISDDEMTALISELDGPALSFLLEEQMNGQEISPSQAALSLNAVSASIANADSTGYTWHYSDPARRGQGRWTANFEITVDATIQTRTHSGDAVLVSKPLKTGGRITFNQSSKVESLELFTIESLPSDPNRSLWTEEARRQRMVSLAYLNLFDFPGPLPEIDTSSWLPGIKWSDFLKSHFDTAGMLPGFDLSGFVPPIDVRGMFGGVDLSDVAATPGVANLIRAAGALTQAEQSSSEHDSGVEKSADSPLDLQSITNVNPGEDSPGFQNRQKKDDQ
ncbi:PIN domain-containing protein [Arthrobacter sp. Soc17.1.1.1]|uniref:PIN domain-containing protein n=1 Tax=Arthrobacter sp. Soc17.1.1.1 TaxID=3121277 RepID=UPI002FE44AA3